MVRNLLGILAFFAGALLLVALTFSATKEAPADFTYISGAEPKSLDPAIITGQLEGRLADALFEGLTYRDPKTLLPVPGAAASWDISPDGLTWTFRMRPDARWTDGTPVTAHDFAWSWRRLQLPEIASEYAYILHMIRGAEILNTYEGNAQALIGPGDDPPPTADALLDFLDRHPDGATRDAWRGFVKEQNLNESLKGVEEPLLREALTFRGDHLGPDELRAIHVALVAEGERRRTLAAQADATFGISSGVYARDDATLVVELRALTPYFLELTSFYPTFPVPRHVVEQEGNALDWFLPEKIVSNGPYRLGAWRVNDKIRLLKSDTYWNPDSIQLDIVDALPTENAATLLNLYLTDEAAWISGGYPQDLVDDLRQRDDFYSNQGLGVYYYRFNCTSPPFDDVRVRHALCLAIDRVSIVQDIMKLGQLPATTFVPPAIPSYEPPDTAIAFDPERARALLAEAGFPEGRGFPKVSILFNTSEAHRKVAENVAFQLRENLGLEGVSAFNQEWQAYQQSVRDGEYQIARAGWIGDYQDPNTFLDMWVTNGGNNQTGWSSPTYDRLIEYASDVAQFLKEPEPFLADLKERERMRDLLAVWKGLPDGAERVKAAEAVRMQLFREAEAIIVQDAFPVLPLYFYVWSGLVKPEVGGFVTELEMPDGSRRPNLQDLHPLRGLRMRTVDGETR